MKSSVTKTKQETADLAKTQLHYTFFCYHVVEDHQFHSQTYQICINLLQGARITKYKNTENIEIGIYTSTYINKYIIYICINFTLLYAHSPICIHSSETIVPCTYVPLRTPGLSYILPQNLT